MSITPFDSIRMLSETKVPHTEQELREMNLWMVLRGFSMDKGTVLYADMINRLNVTPLMAHDFLLTALPKRRFYSKWAKPKKDLGELIPLISEHYVCNARQAEEYLSCMTDEDIETFRHSVERGGGDRVKKASKTS